MNKNLLILLLAAGISILFFANGLYAGTEFYGEITIDYNKYPERYFKLSKRNYVEFPHALHVMDFELSCEQCHHVDLELDDEVQPCAECHIELTPTTKNRKSIILLRNAYHASCRECHKEFNKEVGDPRGFKKTAPPTSCSGCHIKKDINEKK